MTDWAKHGFGPGTNICARCKGAKADARRKSKWCAKCDGTMRARRSTGALDDPTPNSRITPGTRPFYRGR